MIACNFKAALLDLPLNYLISPFSNLFKIMALKKRSFSFLFLVLAGVIGTAACRGTMIGETAFVVSEKADVRNSTAKANNSVGGLKRGDQITIIERATQGESSYVKIKGPDGIEGWTSPTNLATQSNVDKSKEIAAQISGITAQAECRNRKSVKLRATPDRSSDANVLVQLPAGVLFEIASRETKPKMVDPTAKPATKTEPDEANKAPESNYEVWYRVRVKDNTIVPAGYVYGGSVDLEVPQEIQHFAQEKKRIVGWQRLGIVKDSKGLENYHFVIFQKSVPSADEKSDFDYLHIIGFDAKNRSVSYYNVLREEMRGSFPVKTTLEGQNATFSFDSLDASNNRKPIVYSVITGEKGHLRADRPGLPANARR